MSSAELQQLHIDLLRILNAVADVGIREEDVLVRIRAATYPGLTAPQLAMQLRALADRRLVISFQPALGAERWKITGLGNANLQEAGLA